MRAWHRPLVALGLLAPACGPSSAPPAQRASTGATSPLHPLVPADEAIQPEPATTTTTEPPAPATTVTVTVSKLPPTTSGTTVTTYVLPEAEGEEDDETWWQTQPGYVAPAPGREALLRNTPWWAMWSTCAAPPEAERRLKPVRHLLPAGWAA